MAALGWWGTSRPSSAITPGSIRSIAVLPLKNFSGDPAQDYLADGMTDELIGTLGRLGRIFVISRTSVMAFKGSSKSVAGIAKTWRRCRARRVGCGSDGAPGRNRADGPRVRINARA